MTVKIKNNAINNITVGINTTDTTITVANGSLFPVIDTGDYFYCTLQNNTDIEIVKVIEKVGNILTVERAQDNTTAKSFPSNSKIDLRLNVAQLDEFIADKIGAINHNDLSNRDEAGNHSKITPSIDSTTAFQITKADGTTPMLNIDTTNNIIGVGGIIQTASDTNSSVRIDGSGATSQQNVAFLRGGDRKWFWGLGTQGTNPDLIAYSDDLSSTTLRVSGVTGNVGIGTSNPTEKLDVNGTIISTSGRLEANADNLGYQANLVLRTYLNSNIQSSLTFVSARGSLASPTNSLSNDRLMAMYINGYNGTELSSNARIMVQADGNWSSTNHGTKLSIALTPTNSTTLTDVFTALGNGNVGIGTSNPTHNLSIQDSSGCSVGITCGTASGDQALLLFRKGSTTRWVLGSGSGSTPSFIIYNQGRGESDFLINDTTGVVQLPKAYSTTVTGRDLHVSTTGTLGYVSSTRESKNNIDYNLDSSWIYDLKPVSFKYRKQDENGNYIEETDGIYREGLIAEDVNEVRPEMCYKDDDGTLRGVDYKYIIASLLKEVQELNKRVQELEYKNGK